MPPTVDELMRALPQAEPAESQTLTDLMSAGSLHPDRKSVV